MKQQTPVHVVMVNGMTPGHASLSLDRLPR